MFRGSNERNEMMQLIKILRRAPGARTTDATNRLIAYGTACLELLIRETKLMTGHGSASGPRDWVFMHMRASDALSIAEQLTYDHDRDIQLVAAIAISKFDYEGSDNLKRRGISTLRDVQQRAKYRGDNYANKLMDTLIVLIEFQEYPNCHARLSGDREACPYCYQELPLRASWPSGY